jgi:pyruvate kinase
LIRKTAADMGVEVQVLGDLQGPKFRVGELAAGPVAVADGDVLEFGIKKDEVRGGRGVSSTFE